MALCNISIEYDSKSRQFVGGDTVRGTVHVEVNANCECNELKVELCWYTHGSGNRAEKSVAEAVLFRDGKWDADDNASYPFELTLPNGPRSYHGSHLKVDWMTRASADIAWAKDPKCQEGFLLVGSADADPQSYIAGIPRAGGPSSLLATNEGSLSIGGLLLAICLFFMGGALVYGGIFEKTGRDAQLLVAGLGAVFSLVGLALGAYVMRVELVVMKLGNFRVRYPKEIVHAGDTVPVEIDIENVKGLNGLEANLICRELTIKGHDPAKTLIHEIAWIEIELSEAGEATQPGAQKGVTFKGEVVIPEGMPPSFYAQQSELVWLIEVYIDIANCPDWREECFLDLRPRAGERAKVEIWPSVKKKRARRY